jgi:hypothetical protein
MCLLPATEIMIAAAWLKKLKIKVRHLMMDEL